MAAALRHKRRPGREGVVLEGEVRMAATAGARVREEQSAERGARSAGRMQREDAVVAAAAAVAARRQAAEDEVETEGARRQRVERCWERGEVRQRRRGRWVGGVCACRVWKE